MCIPVKLQSALLRASRYWAVNAKTTAAWGLIRQDSNCRDDVVLCFDWRVEARGAGLAAIEKWTSCEFRLYSGAPMDIEPAQEFGARPVVRNMSLLHEALCIGCFAPCLLD